MKIAVIPNVINRRESLLLAGIMDKYLIEHGKRPISEVRKAAICRLHPYKATTSKREELLLNRVAERVYAAVRDEEVYARCEIDGDWIVGANIEAAHYEPGDYWDLHSDEEYLSDGPVLTAILPVMLADHGGYLKSTALIGKKDAPGLRRAGTPGPPAGPGLHHPRGVRVAEGPAPVIGLP